MLYTASFNAVSVYDFELLRYIWDSILHCALMYKIKRQLWFPTGINKVQCFYHYSTYCCSWDDMIQHVLNELNLPYCARRPVMKDHSWCAPWRESGGRSLALSLRLSKLCWERCSTHKAVCDIIRQWTYTHQKQNTQLKGFTGKIQAGLHVTAFTILPMADKDHDTKGPSFCRHKGPILLSTQRAYPLILSTQTDKGPILLLT